MAKEKRDNIISFTTTEKEKRILTIQAMQQDISLSDLVRHKCLADIRKINKDKFIKENETIEHI